MTKKKHELLCSPKAAKYICDGKKKKTYDFSNISYKEVKKVINHQCYIYNYIQTYSNIYNKHYTVVLKGNMCYVITCCCMLVSLENQTVLQKLHFCDTSGL